MIDYKPWPPGRIPVLVSPVIYEELKRELRWHPWRRGLRKLLRSAVVVSLLADS